MRRIVLFLLSTFALAVCAQDGITYTKPIPKDSLPDLWVVCVDVSGSMLDRSVRGNLQGTSSRIDALISRYGNKYKDKYILLRSGASKSVLLNVNESCVDYDELSLVSHLIRDDSDIMDYSRYRDKVWNLCNDESSFHYDMSFTSLIRPLSIYVLGKCKVDFLKYNDVYHVLVTDDGDINDQWLQDYKWMKKWAGKHFACYNKILPTIASSEFDFTDRKTGKFVEIEAFENKQPHIYLTKYKTFQDEYPENVYSVSSLLDVCDFHSQSIGLTLKNNYDSICLIYIDSCGVNGKSVKVGKYLYPGDTIYFTYSEKYKKAFNNSISIDGYYQEKYTDNILGVRYRNVGLNGVLGEKYVLAETQSAILKTIVGFAVVLIVLFALFVLWRSQVALRIYVNGKCWHIRRRALYRMKNDEYVLLKIVCDGHCVANTVFYRGEGMWVTDDNRTKQGETKLVMESAKVLSPSYSEVFHTEDQQYKRIVVDFNPKAKGKSVQFQYSDYLSHNLVICFEATSVDDDGMSENLLRQRNIQMLAKYYESTHNQFRSRRNNVMVNIIPKETLGEEYKQSYAVLNIFDLNSENRCDKIFLRYSLMCFFDAKDMSNESVTRKMLEIAHGVVKSEHQRLGQVETDAYANGSDLKSDISVDVSPMLTYLFLLKKDRSRLIYSPFVDGCFDMKNKTVRLFPKSDMILLNLPMRNKHPHTEIDGPTSVLIKSVKRIGNLLFLGEDVVSLMGAELNCAYGRRTECVDGVTFVSWNIDNQILTNK